MEPATLTAKTLAAVLGLGISITTVASGPQDDLENRLQRELQSVEARFIGHETITTRERAAPKTYLLLDFHYDEMPPQEELQASIHSICTEVLRNQELVRDLSRNGVNMVSVAFDRRHQYDCL